MLHLALAALLTQEAPAETLNQMFGDHMVLQRQSKVPVWGWSKPGQVVTVAPSWTGRTSKATADAGGKWIAWVQTPKAGGPYEINVRGATSRTIADVLIGEVWLCSGQSNMEWPLRAAKDGDTFIAEASDPKIRLFYAPKRMEFEPQTNSTGKWETTSPESSKRFSAVGYLYARYLRQALNVPVGVIDASWGGTECELWTSVPGLRKDKQLAKTVDAKLEAQKAASESGAQRAALLASDAKNSIWAQQGVTEGFQSLPTMIDFEHLIKPEFDGTVWYRAEFQLAPPQTTEDAILDLGAIDDEDVTWVNGSKVGENDQWDAERHYSIPKSLLKAGTNVLYVRAVDTGGAGGFTTPDKIQVRTSAGAVKPANWSWRLGVDLTNFPPPGRGFRAAALFNGMIAPIAPYRIKGALWYQGESNVGRAFQYRTSFASMIKDWRAHFGSGDFPFYFVQIAPFNYNAQGRSAELRDSQTVVAKTLKNAGMVVISDLVDNLADIHPVNKLDVAERLNRLALKRVYGFGRIEDSGPIFKSATIEGDKVRLSFDRSRGLTVRGVELQGVAIAGADLIFRPAQGKVEKGQLIVWAEGLSAPQYVRLGWGDAAVSNLFNGAGLPAWPFRTDDLPLLTRDVVW